MLKMSSAITAPTPADGRVERIVSGMNIALVENAKHDIDGGDARPRSAAARCLSDLLKGPRLAGKLAVNRDRNL